MTDPTIRIIDPLQIAQERFERYCKTHALYVAGDTDDLQVAEVAALIAIAGLLRALAFTQAGMLAHTHQQSGTCTNPTEHPQGCRCAMSGIIGEQPNDDGPGGWRAP